MCTGRFHENGRPPPFSRCTQPCIHDGGRWGSTYCYIEDGNWGAPCVPCKGKIQENGVKIVAFCHSKIPFYIDKSQRHLFIICLESYIRGNLAVRGCPHGYSIITDSSECRKACDDLGISVATISGGHPCYEDSENNCNQNGQNGQGAKFVCTKSGILTN